MMIVLCSRRAFWAMGIPKSAVVLAFKAQSLHHCATNIAKERRVTWCRNGDLRCYESSSTTREWKEEVSTFITSLGIKRRVHHLLAGLFRHVISVFHCLYKHIHTRCMFFREIPIEYAFITTGAKWGKRCDHARLDDASRRVKESNTTRTIVVSFLHEARCCCCCCCCC
jgi:hypothetical protein